MTLHAFVDESRRGSTYLLAAALIEPQHLAPIRTLMRGLRMPGARRIHFKHERDTVQKDIAAAIVEAEVRARVYVGRGKSEAVRRAALGTLVGDLASLNPHRLILDTRGEAADRADRGVIASAKVRSARFPYEHLRSFEEPGLWLPDAVAWCWGAGGEWRKRIDPVIDAVRDVVPR
ncbi:MAG TPA: hypothetical protein VM677_01595 [Actinokineospora sp.]|nr:hypothetical protein [Actinokineospora sp.]